MHYMKCKNPASNNLSTNEYNTTSSNIKNFHPVPEIVVSGLLHPSVT